MYLFKTLNSPQNSLPSNPTIANKLLHKPLNHSDSLLVQHTKSISSRSRIIQNHKSATLQLAVSPLTQFVSLLHWQQHLLWKKKHVAKFRTSKNGLEITPKRHNSDSGRTFRKMVCFAGRASIFPDATISSFQSISVILTPTTPNSRPKQVHTKSGCGQYQSLLEVGWIHRILHHSLLQSHDDSKMGICCTAGRPPLRVTPNSLNGVNSHRCHYMVYPVLLNPSAKRKVSTNDGCSF